MRKPPEGDSWIKFHDYMMSTNPELMQGNKTLVIMRPPDLLQEFINKKLPKGVQKDDKGFFYDEKDMPKYVIRANTIRRYCWEELQEYRLNKDCTYDAVEALRQAPQTNDCNAEGLLIKIML